MELCIGQSVATEGIFFAARYLGLTLEVSEPVSTGIANAYALSETFSWKSSLDEKFSNAKEFYLCVIVSTLLGVLFSALNINAMTALFWSAVINGVVAPPVLVLIMLMANRKDIMGKRTNSILTNALGWLTTVLMFLAVLAMAFTMVK